MPETEVNRLSKRMSNLKRNYYKVMEKLLGPRWASGLSVRMPMSNAEREKLEANARALLNKEVALQKELNSALNRNATSLKAQQRNIQRQITAMYNVMETAVKALKNLNARAARATTNAEKANIEREKMPHRRALRLYKANKPKLEQLEKNRSNLMRAINIRRKVLNRERQPEMARKTIARYLSASIVPHKLYALYGTRTAEARRQFNTAAGRQNNYLENYYKAMRRVERLESALKRKRNNNNRNNKGNASPSPKARRRNA